ncbi:PREDICTED: RING finger protein 11-like [Camelina sativa]|uniref:RING-type E3 ubiquitin transferase n=1 Tax=Camelina sativa TaxID=90675 RepID=A0ABM1RL91_CAMSA|nr:PREDICTED: RING finger protein 11-like [Camelina sativa]
MTHGVDVSYEAVEDFSSCFLAIGVFSVLFFCVFLAIVRRLSPDEDDIEAGPSASFASEDEDEFAASEDDRDRDRGEEEEEEEEEDKDDNASTEALYGSSREHSEDELEVLELPLPLVPILPQDFPFPYNRECGICFGEFVPEDPLANIPCQHAFHLACLSDLVRCPLCRR